jgi:hypothetical protein
MAMVGERPDGLVNDDHFDEFLQQGRRGRQDEDLLEEGQASFCEQYVVIQIALAELGGIRGAEQEFARRGMRLEELPRALSGPRVPAGS